MPGHLKLSGEQPPGLAPGVHTDSLIARQVFNKGRGRDIVGYFLDCRLPVL